MMMLFTFQGAESGIFNTIGNGLRQHPEWTVNEHLDGVTAVKTGQSVYIGVKVRCLQNADSGVYSQIYF